MGRQIIKQPNGKYCIFSSEVDTVTHYDMTPDEIIEEWTKEAKADITQKVHSVVEQLERGAKPYYQFTKSYEDMLEVIKLVRGKSEYKTVKSLIGHK